jgi:alpha-tubulin suppressor-like RCC1 family protein
MFERPRLLACGRGASQRASGRRSLGPLVLSLLAIAFVAAPGAANASTGGAALGWGENIHTELGAGYYSALEESPVAVMANEEVPYGAGATNMTQIVAGKEFTLALLENGRVLSWGLNEQAQLGDGTKGNGKEVEGKLGYGTWEKAVTDVFVSEVEREGKWEHTPLEGVKEISGGGEHGMALLSSGHVVAWGDNEWGQLGNGKGGYEYITGESTLTPKEVVGKEGKGKLTNVTMIASGGESNFAVLSGNKTMMAWGGEAKGQLGLGELEAGEIEECIESQGELNAKGEHFEPCVTYPHQIPFPAELKTILEGGATITAVAAHATTAYILLSTGEVWGWGSNIHGQLGVGLPKGVVSSSVPQRVHNLGTEGGLGKATAIAAGNDHALAILSTGEVVAWGNDEYGEMGAGSTEVCSYDKPAKEEGPRYCVATPKKVGTLASVTAIGAGLQDSFVVTGGKIYAFGKNTEGDLGIGTSSSTTSPTEVKGVSNVTAVSGNNSHTAALLANGVSAPAPIMRVKPGTKTLKVSWALPTEPEEIKLRLGKYVRAKPLSPEWATVAILTATNEHSANYAAHSYTFGAEINSGVKEAALEPVMEVAKVLGIGGQDRLAQGQPEP